MKKTRKWLSAMLVLTMITSILSGATAAAATTPYIKSDTPSTLSIASGGYYIFKFTVVGTVKGTPTFTSGSPDLYEVYVTEQSGNNYYVRVNSLGQYGDSAGLYSKLPGQAAVRQAVLKTTESVKNFATSKKWSYGNGNRSSRGLFKQWIGVPVENHLFGADEYSATQLTVTNENPDVLELTSWQNYTPSTNITVNATTAEETERLSGLIWGSDGIQAPSENRFSVKGIKAGTGTIIITSKSPKTGQIFTDTEIYTICDPSANSIQSDTTTQVNVAMNKSYTFKCTVSSEALSQANFYTEGNVYDKESGQTQNYGLQAESTYAGNGVYYVTVTAKPFFDDYNLKSGDVFTLYGGLPSLNPVAIGTIKLV